MYTIKLLEDRDFDKLPYKHATNHEVCGMANPQNNTAYIRNSMTDGMKLLTMDHELQELTSKFSEHEEDGIRYGWFKKIFGFSSQPFVRALAPIAAAMIPGVGPILSGLLAAGTSAIAQKTTTGNINIGSALLSGVAGGAFKGLSGFGAGVAASKAAGGGMVGQMLSGAQGALLGTTGAGGMHSLATASGGPVSSMLGAGSTLLGNAATSGAAGGTAGAAGTGGIFNLASPMKMLGLGSLAMASMPTTAQLPQIGTITSKWLTADTVTAAGAKAKTMADASFGGEWSPDKETLAFTEVMEKDIRKTYQLRKTQMDQMASVSNESWVNSGERLEMLRRVDEEEQREVDAMKSEWMINSKKTYDTQRYTYIMDQLGVDEATKRDLLYGELSDVINKYNVAEADLTNFRKLASDAGMYLIQNG